MEQKAEGITGALYAVSGDKSAFECSGFAFEKVSGGYLFATAGHCAKNEDGSTDFSVKKVTFSEDESEPFYPAVVIGRSETDDVAVYFIETKINIDLLPVASEKDSEPGANIIDPSYILDSGKLVYHGRLVRSYFPHKSPLDDNPEWKNDMPVNLTAAPGSSGSPIIDTDRGVIIGILVGGYAYPQDIVEVTVAVKSSALIDLRGTIWDRASTDVIPPPKYVPETIPDKAFEMLFGKDHPFYLNVYGTQLKFMQGGYVFETVFNGFELSDEYYYKVPVYIEKGNVKNEYRLTSTKEPHYSVAIKLAN